MLKDFDVGWFEEPVCPDAIEDYCELRRCSPVPIAGCEVLTRRQSFIPWLTRGAIDIVQPDVTKVGGISEQRRIAWMAYDFGVKYVGTAGTRPSASLPICRWHRRSPTPIWSSSSTGVPMWTASLRSLWHSRRTGD